MKRITTVINNIHEKWRDARMKTVDPMNEIGLKGYQIEKNTYINKGTPTNNIRNASNVEFEFSQRRRLQEASEYACVEGYSPNWKSEYSMQAEVVALGRFFMKRPLRRYPKSIACANAKSMGQQHTIGWTKMDFMVVGAIRQRTWGLLPQG